MEIDSDAKLTENLFEKMWPNNKFEPVNSKLKFFNTTILNPIGQ